MNLSQINIPKVSYNNCRHKTVTHKKRSNLMTCLQNSMQKVCKQFNNTHKKTVYSHELIRKYYTESQLQLYAICIYS